VAVWDRLDVSEMYSENQPVLAPELLLHTNSNRGPFLAEPGDHFFEFSIFSTNGDWQHMEGCCSGNQSPFYIMAKHTKTTNNATRCFALNVVFPASFWLKHLGIRIKKERNELPGGIHEKSGTEKRKGCT